MYRCREHSQTTCVCDERLKTLLAEDLRQYFELLMLAYQHKLITFVCLIYSRQHAEDVVQETFIKVYGALTKSTAEDIQALHLRPWLFRIAYNLAQNHRTRTERFNGHFVSFSIDQPEGLELFEAAENGQCLSAEAEVENEETRAEVGDSLSQLRMCIRRLPEKQQLPVLLHYIAGLEYREIAMKLHQPLNTVKSNGYRGFLKLREMMRGGEVIDGKG